MKPVTRLVHASRAARVHRDGRGDVHADILGDARCDGRALLVATIACLGAIAGPVLAQTASWRLATVRQIAVLSEVDPVVDTDCTPKPADGSDPAVLVVAYRSGRAMYWMSLPMASDAGLHVGDEVSITSAACRWREAAAVRPAVQP